MALVIPVGAMAVVQPLRLVTQSRNVSVTYAVNHTFNPITEAEAQTLINDLQTQWNTVTQMVTSFDSQVTMNAPSGYYLQSVGGVLRVATAQGPTAVGGQNVSTPPPNVAVLIKKVTGVVGKAFRGRMYMPWFVNETDVAEDGTITPSVILTIQTRVNAWKSAVEAMTSVDNLVLLHQLGSPGAGGATPITSLQVEAIVATQRRRVQR